MDSSDITNDFIFITNDVYDRRVELRTSGQFVHKKFCDA